MTWPLEYQKAAVDFERFMVAARDAAGVPTTNVTWTMVQGVFLAWRRRLTIRQAIAFANVLPPLLRAMFLDDWHPHDTPAPFASRAELTAEVQALRAAHNFSSDNAIEAVAVALRAAVGDAVLDKVLAGFPPEAARFWDVGPTAVLALRSTPQH